MGLLQVMCVLAEVGMLRVGVWMVLSKMTPPTNFRRGMYKSASQIWPKFCISNCRGLYLGNLTKLLFLELFF